jgi:hypothetical protein
MRRALGLTALAIIVLAGASQPAWAQRPKPTLPVYGHTLMQGSGYIATPHAMVPKSSLFVTGSVIAPEGYQQTATSAIDDYTVTRVAAGISLGGILEVGAYGLSKNGPGLFGKLQLVRQQGVFPAMAVGVQNVTTANNGRYGIEDDYYSDIQKSATIYGVFTYVVGPGRTSFPSFVTISGGWGTGLFFENNPQIDSDNRTSGIFGAISMDFQAGENAYLRFMGEWDGFALNVGALANLAGLELSVGLLSVGEGAVEYPLPGQAVDVTQTFPGQFYNQLKPYVSLTVDFRALGVIPWVWTSTDEE